MGAKRWRRSPQGTAIDIVVVREVFRRRHISAPLVEHAYAQAREQDIQDVELMVAELKAATADDAQRVAHTDSRVCQKKWWGL